MANIIFIPPTGSAYWSDPIANLASFPVSDTQYTVRMAEDTGILYYWDGAAWTPVVAFPIYGALSAVSPLLYNGTGQFSIQVATALQNGYLSSADWSTFNGKQDLIVAATTADYYRGDKTFQSLSAAVYALLSATAPLTFSAGNFAMPAATSLVDGYLTSADWNTFNSKQPAITPGTSADYYRGDLTFQTLEMPALSSVVSGASPATGAINEVLTASQATNTTSGVAASGSYGAVVSQSFTAGRWMIYGTAGFNENGAVLTDGMQCGISSSATGAGLSEFDTCLSNALISSTSDLLLATPPVVVFLSSPTTYYLNTKFNYTSGTPRHRGKITGVRIG